MLHWLNSALANAVGVALGVSIAFYGDRWLQRRKAKRG